MSEPMILDGKTLAKETRKALKQQIQALQEKHPNAKPVLATILVGDDPASATYVKMKQTSCKKVGMESLKVEMPKQTTTAELLAKIQELNADENVRGILLQHPVPKQIDERVCFDAIALEKDVDGVTCLGFGMMAMGENVYGSATPQGIMTLIDHYKIDLKGKDVVVVGRSPILGKPLAMMMLNKHATVTICHSRTENLADKVKAADVVVGAVGIPNFIKAEWIKDGAVIIDAGYHPAENCGDVDLAAAAEKSSAYTPVPGGVGPMTIATLIAQTVDSATKYYQ
ncbi:MAG: bifunctional 5,10-methylene-tetrahydrofolate dehydrogenase/5,10-methylene-tetrahydrofolate cyclohydrolase [Deltaproteobacteria bacterium]|nr:bifunctional 5,10-methylene-tetrahydrofolate dehydrogenase/5,10-methylene-tetrahydrofolate cyclohydrolase [Deltaproteobacteria bacterium]MBN2672190.1 bifunctional 5,10-methylene-tetrahydrofolate dehydrogenase/5,10-methylene-tetrahydrofolate cyclohydrolase [Deltaproteobacteria bacterium]